MPDQPSERLPRDLADLPDVEFMAWLALRRGTYEHEAWRTEGIRAAKIAIRQLNEYLLMAGPTAATVHPALDKLVPLDPPTLRRAYQVFLDRAPSGEEADRWLAEPLVSAAALCNELLESFESYQIDGLAEQSSKDGFRARRQTHYHTRIQDAFIGHMTGDRARAGARPAFVEALGRRPLRIVSASGPNDAADRAYVLSHLAEAGVEATLAATTFDAIADGSALADCDILLTDNHLVYDRQQEQLDRIAGAAAVTICWHMDNHHEFDLSSRLAAAFDYIFPAHPGSQACLHGGTAIVGPTVPCGSSQWTADEASALFAAHGGEERSEKLYGRFNSYPGRNALRDDFLRLVGEHISDDVAVVAPGGNDWFSRTPADRFRDLSSRKVVLCGVIYNDISLRLFDALLAGALPLVPYGLPGLGQAFDLADPDTPVIQYRPENLGSLQRAIREGCARFDREGAAGILARHELSLSRHLLRNRVATMLLEVACNRAHC